jgi:F0F1-type ATP synthase assembly protein I
MENNNEPKFKKIVEGANDLSLGISIVVAVLVGIGIGILMRDLFNISWLFWLGVFWGIGGAFLNIYKVYKKQKKILKDLTNDAKY